MPPQAPVSAPSLNNNVDIKSSMLRLSGLKNNLSIAISSYQSALSDFQMSEEKLQTADVNKVKVEEEISDLENLIAKNTDRSDPNDTAALLIPLEVKQQVLAKGEDWLTDMNHFSWGLINKKWPANKGRFESLEFQDVNSFERSEKEKYGEFTMNPDTYNLAMSKYTPQILNVAQEDWYKELNDKSEWRVAKEIIRRYGNEYHLPGLEYVKWLMQEKRKWPQPSDFPVIIAKGDPSLVLLGSTYVMEDGDREFTHFRHYGPNGSLVFDGHRGHSPNWTEYTKVVMLPRAQD
jgi:hypothetical protein